MTSRLERALAYHERTKHHPHRFARSAGHLDWANQPDPFRRFSGAELEELALPHPDDFPSLDQCYAPERLQAHAIDASSIAQLLHDSVALSAWKVFGANRWSLRVNPSSGNLHPTEVYLIGDRLQHYAPYLHALETRREVSIAPLIAGLTSIHWREAWKYGERAYRYCQHDAGHAIAALAFSAAAMGWKTRVVEAPDRDAARLLGIDGQHGVEAEHPDVLLAIGPDAEWGVLPAFTAGPLAGEPNRLSAQHVHWEVIDEVAEACVLDAAPSIEPWSAPPIEEPLLRAIPARPIFHQRRSAVDLDGKTSIRADAFLRVVRRLMPGRVPFDAFWWRPAIHLAFFVHRVDGLEPGVYFLVREPELEGTLRASMDPTFDWERVDPELPLYRLGEGDVRRTAAMVCCQQEIAGDGAFAVAMLGDMTRLGEGAWFYRRLHFEAGAIGQVLYLEAEAAGIRGTGIGCFFDDLISQALRIQSNDLTTIYCFTAGGPVEDPRIQSEPAYAHLQKQ